MSTTPDDSPSKARAPEGLRPSFAKLAFVVLSLLAVVPVLVLGYLESENRAEELREVFDVRAQQQVSAVHDMLVQFLRGKEEVLLVTAGTLQALPSWEPGQLQKIGDAQLLATNSFEAFYVADVTGRSIVFAPSIRKDGTPTRAGVDYSDRDYYQELIVTKRPTYSHVQVGKQSKTANIVVAVPILDPVSSSKDDELRGYVAAGIRVPLVMGLVKDILHFEGNTEEDFRVLVVDAEQKVLVDSEARAELRLSILEKVPEKSSWSEPCPTARHEYLSTDERGVVRRMACSPMRLGEQTWTVYAGIPNQRIVESVERAKRTTIQFAGLALVLSVVISGGLALGMSQHMERFHSIARRIASGERNVDVAEVPWFSPKEVIVLSRVVNGTLRELERADVALQGLVQDLRDTNQRIAPLAAAWEQTSDAVEVLSDDGVVQFVNPAWCELMGLQQDDVVGKVSALFRVDRLKDPNLSGEGLLELLRGGSSWTGEVHSSTRTGDRIQGVVVTPVMDEHQQRRVIIVGRRDLTKLRQAELTAVQNDRLAAIGTLAAGLAHEINNPLTYIQMNLQLIAEGVVDVEPLSNSEVAGLASDAIDGVERVTRIVQDLLALARKSPDEATKPMVSLNVGEVVRAAVSLAGPKTNKAAQVEISVPDALLCMGRESELVQVLLNLIINACQAMAHRGRDENLVQVTGCHDDEFAWIEVRDNGPGIPEDIQRRIFEPLFTTKPVGQGTGLGLSVSRSIIEAHNGELIVDSVVGEGCRFTMKIPVHVPKTEAAQPRAIRQVRSGSETQPRASRDARVLLVDDDPLVARSLGRVLRSLGVVVVDSGPAGLDALESHPFEVVVSDVRMPAMSGPEFHEMAQLIRPVPFVFVTGGTTPEDQRALEQLPWPVLRKPIRGDNLLEVVQGYLDHDPSAEQPTGELGMAKSSA